MAERPGTRRGRQETPSSQEGALTRPATRGKSYLQQPAASTADRPTSRRGVATQQTQAAHDEPPQPQQHRSPWQPPQHTPSAVFRPAQHSTKDARERNAAGPQMQKHPSETSVSLSDLDAMSSSMSVGAPSIDIATGRGAGTTTKATQQTPSAAGSAHEQARRLQTSAAQVWELGRQQQQQKTTATAQTSSADASNKRQPTTTQVAPVAAPTAANAEVSIMSEPSGYSSDFLSIEGSGVEIVYSEQSLQGVGNAEAQQHGPLGQQPTAAAQPARSAITNPAKQTTAAAAAAADPYGISSLTAEDSMISADIEFSKSTLAADAAADATASPAASFGATKANKLAPATAAQKPAATTAAAVSMLSPAATDGRRAAESNLQLTDGSFMSYDSAEIEFEPSTVAVTAAVPKPAATAAGLPAIRTRSGALQPQPMSPARAALASAAGSAAEEAAAATEDLFAMLTAVPHRQDSSNPVSSFASAAESVPTSGIRSATSSPGSGNNNLQHRERSRGSASPSNETVGGTSQQHPAGALDVLQGLEELHGTLQVVRQQSASSSKGSSVAYSESFESDSDAQSTRSSRLHVRSKATRSRTPSVSRSVPSTRPALAASLQAPSTGGWVPPAAAAAAQAAAVAAAAETGALLGNLQVVQQHDMSESSVSDQPSPASTEASDISHPQPKQDGQLGGSDLDWAVTEGPHQAPVPRSNSQATSVDVNEPLQQQTTAAAGGTQHKHRKPPRPGPPAKRRSVALQVGSSNEKGTQVMFDDRRHLLWDGGSLLKQQVNQPGTQVPLLGAARVWGVATGVQPPAGRGFLGDALHSSPLGHVAAQQAPGLTGFSRLGAPATHGSCWSVLSAALQQFRAAALLDQLEGLLKAAAQRPMQQQSQAALQQQQQHSMQAGQPAAQQHGAQSDAVMPSSAATKAPAQQTAGFSSVGRDAGWFSIPVAATPAAGTGISPTATAARGATHLPGATAAAGPAVVAAAATPVEDADWFSLPLADPAAVPPQATTSAARYQQQLQAQPEHEQVVPATINNRTAPTAGWMTLPMAASAEPLVGQPPPEPRPAATAADAKKQAGQLPVDAGWFSLPAPGNSGIDQAQPGSQHSAQTPQAPSDSAGEAGVAAASQDDGWFSLPVPGQPTRLETQIPKQHGVQLQSGYDTSSGVSAANRPSSSSAAASQDAGWFSLPLPGGAKAEAGLHSPSDAAAAAAFELAASTASTDVCPQLPSSSHSEHAAQPASLTAEPVSDSGGVPSPVPAKPDSSAAANTLADEAGYNQSETAVSIVIEAIERYSNTSPASVSSELGLSQADAGTAPASAEAAAVAVSGEQQCTSDFEHASRVIQVDCQLDNSTAEEATRIIGYTTAHPDKSVPLAKPGGMQDPDRTRSPATMADAGAATAVKTEASAVSGAISTGTAQQRSSSGNASDQNTAPEAAGQGQNVSGTVDSMLRYLSYLDSLVSQGMAPPGLTLATARSLRDTLLQTITATQQQSAADVGAAAGQFGIRGLGAMTARAGAASAANLCYEDMISSCCLDSFMSSSLSHLRRKVTVPVARTAWRPDAVRLAVPNKAEAASAAVGLPRTSTKACLDNSPASDNWAVPGRHGALVSGSDVPAKPSGRVGQQSRSGHKYTTLEDTLSLIRQHRARSGVGARANSRFVDLR